MPLTKSERMRRCSPAASTFGYRRRNSAHHDLDLRPGEVGAEAEVGAAAAERQVVVRCAARVERVRVGEVVGIAVGRRVVDDDLVALP